MTVKLERLDWCAVVLALPLSFGRAQRVLALRRTPLLLRSARELLQAKQLPLECRQRLATRIEGGGLRC